MSFMAALPAAAQTAGAAGAAEGAGAASAAGSTAAGSSAATAGAMQAAPAAMTSMPMTPPPGMLQEFMSGYSGGAGNGIGDIMSGNYARGFGSMARNSSNEPQRRPDEDPMMIMRGIYERGQRR